MSGTNISLNLPKTLFARRSPNALILASLVSGFSWYLSNRQISEFNEHQQQLINRVQKDETAENFKTKFDPEHVQDWDCRKVTMEGVVKPGRFFVKRNRGTQEGYLVMAPFVISHRNYSIQLEEAANSNHYRKFILNLGWVPKSHKNLVFNTVSLGSSGEEVIYDNRQQALKKQKQDGFIRDPLIPSQASPIMSVTAYVRKAEKEDRLNGRINYKRENLYKWIDLYDLTRSFRVFNQAEAESIYLEKAPRSADQDQGIPIFATKETVIADLKTESNHYQLNARRQFWLTTGLAFGFASWATFL